jgi:hypothetical protein
MRTALTAMLENDGDDVRRPMTVTCFFFLKNKFFKILENRKSKKLKIEKIEKLKFTKNKKIRHRHTSSYVTVVVFQTLL